MNNMHSKIDSNVTVFNQAFLWRICAIAAMGGLLFGYDLIVIGGAKPFYEAYFVIYNNPWMQGWVMSTAVVGCLIGVLLSGTLADAFGRKKLLILAAVMFTITAIGMALATSLVTFCIFRVVGGMGIGLASALSPMFIAEVTPKQHRGRFVSFQQLTIVIGILAAQIVNLMIADYIAHRFTPKEITARITEIETETRTKINVLKRELDRIQLSSNVLRADALLQAFELDRTPKETTALITEIEGKTRKKIDEGKQEIDKIQQESNVRRAEALLDTWNGQWGWRCMFGAGVVPAFAFLFLLLFVPESPRWLVKNGKSAQARIILANVGGEEYADSEIRDIEQTLDVDMQGRVRFSDLLDRRILPILSFGIFLAVFQQWCGLNVFLLYAEEVFRSAGYDISGLMFNIVITGFINLVFTFIAIATIDRWGRRPLMLFGAGGLAILHAILGYCFCIGMTGPLVLVLVLAFIGCFAMTLGPTVWVILAEIFPNRIRGAAMSVAVASLWMANLVLTQTFPLLNSALKAHGTFWIYGGICAVSFVVIFLKLPETKGKSLEEIEKVFLGKEDKG